MNEQQWWRTNESSCDISSGFHKTVLRSLLISPSYKQITLLLPHFPLLLFYDSSLPLHLYMPPLLPPLSPPSSLPLPWYSDALLMIIPLVCVVSYSTVLFSTSLSPSTVILFHFMDPHLTSSLRFFLKLKQVIMTVNNYKRPLKTNIYYFILCGERFNVGHGREITNTNIRIPCYSLIPTCRLRVDIINPQLQWRTMDSCLFSVFFHMVLNSCVLFQSRISDQHVVRWSLTHSEV